ncbi:hypothetical protein NUU61_003471 [Penicillium alfredii]|uniref:Uncharacterized protein n=1 Tax=Penicillium alfredii TaxID=1506179 RepID=A0A9W9KCH7_9EURO|nr:uncharacterized protein NUU61_003471 [Penicillium alfredii]KAJ5101249.1 hypothetical protein NUU61_003471 [Penicillium alfredii]
MSCSAPITRPHPAQPNASNSSVSSGIGLTANDDEMGTGSDSSIPSTLCLRCSKFPTHTLELDDQNSLNSSSTPPWLPSAQNIPLPDQEYHLSSLSLRLAAGIDRYIRSVMAVPVLSPAQQPSQDILRPFTNSEIAPSLTGMTDPVSRSSYIEFPRCSRA